MLERDVILEHDGKWILFNNVAGNTLILPKTPIEYVEYKSTGKFVEVYEAVITRKVGADGTAP